MGGHEFDSCGAIGLVSSCGSVLTTQQLVVGSRWPEMRGIPVNIGEPLRYLINIWYNYW